MAERDPRYFKVYQDGDDRELEQKIQQVLESGAAPGIDVEARESIEEIQRKIDSGEIGGGGGGGGAGVDNVARQKIEEVTEQLAEKVSVKIFDHMPSVDELGEHELGLILPTPKSIFPYTYSFEGANGDPWDVNQFINTEYQGYGTVMDKAASFSEILDNKGHIKVVKSAGEGLASVENKAGFKLDFTNGKKYRIKIDIQRTTITGTNKGNAGISISPSDSLASYYPLNTALTNGICAYFSNDSTNNLVKTRFRKFVDGKQVTDGFVATGGGFTSTPADRLALPEGAYYTLEIIVSTTALKLLVNGTQYLNLTEDLAVLNSSGCKLVIWGANYDTNSLSAEHYFDNLLVEEVV